MGVPNFFCIVDKATVVVSVYQYRRFIDQDLLALLHKFSVAFGIGGNPQLFIALRKSIGIPPIC